MAAKANFNAYHNYVTDSLHQWDTNQVLILRGLNLATAPEVHFSNKNMDRAIVRQASMVNHVVTVNIPNSLLQDPLRIYAHIGIYEGNAFTVVETVEIPVIPRTRPCDYQIEDTDGEIYSFNRLENMMANMATKDQVANIVAGVGSDAELVDVRYGADGKTYSSAGEAVRGQFERLKPGGRNILYTQAAPNNMINKAQLQAGYYVNTSGEKSAGAGWNLSEKIPVAGLPSVWFSGGVGLSCFYNSDDAFLSYVSGTFGEIAVPDGAAYMLASVADEYRDTAMISTAERKTYDEGVVVLRKEPYSAGFIPFTVPVNQTVADTSNYSQQRTENEDYVDVDCILSLPESYSPFGSATKLLMMCHGAGQGVNTWKEHDGYKDIVQKFVDRGYAVFDCNGYKNDELGWSFWGDRRGVEAWRKAYKYVIDHYNVEKTFSIYAFSMGGLTALQLAFHSFPGINCIAMGSPVVNLKACWEDNSLKAVLKTLYGLGAEWDDLAVAGSDPYKRITEIGGEKYCFASLPPIKVWYGSTEQSYGVNKQYAIDLVEAIKNAGGLADYREVNGAGHEISYGGNEICNAEYLVYIERYNRL